MDTYYSQRVDKFYRDFFAKFICRNEINTPIKLLSKTEETEWKLADVIKNAQ